jgi:hypothetical protein
MSDLFNRLSKLVGPGAARNIVASAPSEEDDVIQDFSPENTDFLTAEQIKDAQDFQAAKNREEQGKDASDYYAAMMQDSAPKAEPVINPYNQGPGTGSPTELTPEFLQQFQSFSANANPGYNPGMFPAKQPSLEDHNDINQALAQQTNTAAPSEQILQGGPGGPFGVLHAMPAFNAPVEAPPSPKPVPTQVGASPKPIPTEIGLPPDPMDQGPGSIASLENLLAAQDAARNVRSANNGARGLDLMAAGIAGLGSNSIVKPSGQQLFKDQAAGADQITNDYKDAVAMEKMDAKSPVSRAMQKFAKKLGFDAKGLSAGDMEKVMPYVARAFEGEENRKARHEDLALRIKEMNQRYALAKEDKRALNAEKQDLKSKKENIERFDKMGKIITSEIASSRSSFGKNANNIRSALAIERLVEGRSLNSLNNREIQEVARSLDSLLSQGQATISGTEHLVPKAYRGDVAKIQEYLTAKNKGAGMGSFLKQMLETVKRERELAEEQVKKTQKKILSPYADLRTKDPEAWSTIMKAHELPEDPFEESKTEGSEDLNSEFDKF